MAPKSYRIAYQKFRRISVTIIFPITEGIIMWIMPLDIHNFILNYSIFIDLYIHISAEFSLLPFGEKLFNSCVTSSSFLHMNIWPQFY
jgi:exonuclease I